LKPTKAEMREAASEQTSPERLTELAARDKTLARVVASNCAALGELLDTLSGHPDKAVRKRVVRNPAALAKTVARAGGEFPSDLLDNPAFDLYLIEEPDLLTDVGETTLRALLKRENCPAGFFAYAARQGDTATHLALLMNPSATTEAIDIIRENTRARRKDPGWKAPKALIEACDLHRSNAGEPDWRARLVSGLEQARGSDRPKPEQFALAEVSLMLDSATAERLGQHQQADPISHILFSSLHLDLAANPATPAYVLAGLSSNKNKDVREAVALNPSTATEILSALATDAESSAVRKAVALNPKTAPEILDILATDVQSWVRSAVAKNPSTHWGLLEILAFDTDDGPKKEAQLRLARHRAAPLHILEHVSRSSHRDVLYALISNSAATAEMLKGPLEKLVCEDVRYSLAVAAHRHSPPHVLESLINFNRGHPMYDFRVRSALAANPFSPPHILTAIYAEDEGGNFHSAIAANRSCPEELLRVLATDKEIEVRQAVYSNRSAPSDLRKNLKESLARDTVVPDLIDEWIGDNRWRAAYLPTACIPPAIFEALACNEDAVVRRIIAKKRPNSQPVLEALSKDGSAGVRYAVAGNRATPPHVLEALAEDQNPCIRWMVAENSVATPALRSSMPRGLAGFRDWFRGNVNRLLARDEYTPPHVLEILASDYDDHVRSCVAYNKNTPSQALEMLARDGDGWVRECVVGHPTTPSQALEILARDVDSQVRQRAARHPNFPPRLLDALARDEDAYVRAAVASNPSTPSKILSVLAVDVDCEIRTGLASNPSTPIPILMALAGDIACDVRAELGGNSSSPVELLMALASDENSSVRGAVASNAGSSLEILETLSTDEGCAVKMRFSPDLIVGALAKQNIASRVTCDSVVMEALAREDERDIRKSVAFNSAASGAILEMLAHDKDSVVRRVVASNPSTSIELLPVLANDDDKYVRVGVARNQSTPPDLLAMLALDSERIVRANAASNPAFSGTGSSADASALSVKTTFRLGLTNAGRSASKRIKAARAAADPIAAARELKVGWIKDLTRTTQPGISRLAALAQPECPPDALARAQRSSWWLERCVIAANPGTPLSALRVLAKDGNVVVQAAALETLAGRGESVTG
jgi:hypothetical protein